MAHTHVYTLWRPLLSTLASSKRWLFHHLTAVREKLWHLNWTSFPFAGTLLSWQQTSQLACVKWTLVDRGSWMVKSAAASVMVLFLQPLFMWWSRVFVKHFLEAVTETLMRLPSNPGNGISNQWKATGRIASLSCHLCFTEWLVGSFSST